VTFEKDSNDETITIPVQRIEDVLDLGPTVSPTVSLAGRLQWITLGQRWDFLPDKPPADDVMGGYKTFCVSSVLQEDRRTHVRTDEAGNCIR